MTQDWYSQFFKKIQEDLAKHVSDDMERMMGGLLKEFPLLKGLGNLSQSAQMPSMGYKILGLDKSASDEQVKKRYRDLAKKLHPDVSGEETSALFQIVQMAYEQIAKERGWTKKQDSL